jgi:small subunit ribosomal protein S17
MQQMQGKKVKTLTGTVVSKSGDKSIRVTINYKIKHPQYGKYVRRRTKLGVHDEHNLSSVGDLVEIAECRPYSKDKSWRLIKVLQKSTEE